MIELRPLRLGDYALCVAIEDWVEVDNLVRHGVAAWDGDRLIATAGVLPYWPGVGEAWFALGPDFEPRDTMAGVRRIRDFLARAQHDYRRVQADVRMEHRRWVELLGFALESEMPGYGPDGATYYRYVRMA